MANIWDGILMESISRTRKSLIILNLPMRLAFINLRDHNLITCISWFHIKTAICFLWNCFIQQLPAHRRRWRFSFSRMWVRWPHSAEQTSLLFRRSILRYLSSSHCRMLYFISAQIGMNLVRRFLHCHSISLDRNQKRSSRTCCVNEKYRSNMKSLFLHQIVQCTCRILRLNSEVKSITGNMSEEREILLIWLIGPKRKLGIRRTFRANY